MTLENLETAVILHGLIHRSLRHTVESLRECVLAPLARLGPLDVFFHSWELAAVHNPRGGERGEALDVAEVSRCLPEARGLFESQEVFDASVDWERLFGNNPMRHCCGNEEEARATLMNFHRALESQERAWRFFEEKKTKPYDLVLATRADLRFLEELRLPEELVVALCERREERVDRHLKGIDAHRAPLQAMLWLPKFHSWGGVNDRFAVGNEEGIRIWSNRVAFAEDWLQWAKSESAEWLLMKWLEKKRVRVGFLDFTFQRVRANGEVAERDRELKKSGSEKCRVGREDEMKERGERTSPELKERFLILAREAGARAECFRRVLEPLGKVEVVVDRPVGDSLATTLTERRYIHLMDEEVEGFGGLMGRVGDFPRITAWSRALAHLAATMQEDEAVWFVEDDVAGDAESFARLVKLTRAGNPDLAALDIRSREADPHWYFWYHAEGCFEQPARAFQPLCRLSGRLIREVLRFREERGGFTFHEVLFASIARRDGMKLLDWREDPECRACFSTFVFRPEVSRVERGIAHPVKDAVLHEAICAMQPTGFPRMRRAKLDGWSILADDYVFLAKLCRMYGIRKVVEFGPGDSTLALLDASCAVLSYEHDIGWLRDSVARFENELAVELVHCPEGTLPDVPRFVPDLVFVDGPPFREGQAMSRIGPCEWALETCGCFLLHDAKRQGELATLEEMERRGFHVARIPTRKGMALVVVRDRCPELYAATNMANPHSGNGSQDWEPGEWFIRRVMFHEIQRAVKVLHAGAGDGRRMSVLLDQIFVHPASEVHAIGCYDGPAGERLREAFEENARISGGEGRVHLYEGESREILAWMIAGEGYWESFDFIVLDGRPGGPELLADICQAWSLLKPGGVLDVAKSGPDCPVAQALLRVFSGRLDTVIDSDRLAVVKR